MIFIESFFYTFTIINNLFSLLKEIAKIVQFILSRLDIFF
ncbi:hypothetical protein HMPREF1860_02168 [Prevotella amnii]|uniref:Uncharacterized protein n=1 Tax=Prevotella amnii TaxID=419005 RepID=A0A134B2L6_9BACT|nr:hypothetical protein HMPREF1860_02168 [Prevotella amnii]